MNKIQFKYIPIGGYFTDNRELPNKYLKCHYSTFDGDSEWYSYYQRIPFKDAKIGETIWWINEEGTIQQKYRKLHDGNTSNAVQENGRIHGLFYPDHFCIVLRPERTSPVFTKMAKLGSLKPGQKFSPTNWTYWEKGEVFTFNGSDGPISFNNPLAILVFMTREKDGLKYYGNSTQEVLVVEDPPKLMLSALKPGTHFEFKHGWKGQEFVKMSSLSNEARLYYRDFKNVIYWRPLTDDQEVVETIPF